MGGLGSKQPSQSDEQRVRKKDRRKEGAVVSPVLILAVKHEKAGTDGQTTLLGSVGSRLPEDT